MRKFLGLIFLIINIQAIYAQKSNIKCEFEFAESQIDYMLEEIDKGDFQPDQVSPRTIENNELKLVVGGDWTSGFFPGVLWYLYEYNGNEKWLKKAQDYTSKLKTQQFNTGTHDLGFMIYCSFGNGYRLTKDESYKDVIINAAKSLSSRFDPKTGVIKSWDHHKDKWQYPVIIDNMMNLELLFEATKFTGDSSFYKIAVTHANNTLENHFRKDYSSYHVIDYHPETGEVLNKHTHQGYSDESAWARGQAWALYGFTLVYRETGDTKYLNQANNIASFILNHPNLPKDMIPYWDYNDPTQPNTSRDVSAAAITASALYELAEYNHKKYYQKKADKIIKNITKKYQSDKEDNSGFILDHSTGHRPYKSEIDVPIIYADYYYLEALLRSRKGFSAQLKM